MMMSEIKSFEWDPAYLLQRTDKDMCKETMD